MIDFADRMDSFVWLSHQGRLDDDEHELAVQLAMIRFSGRVIASFEGVSVGELVNTCKTMARGICIDVQRTSIRRREHEGRSLDAGWDADAEDRAMQTWQADEAAARLDRQERSADVLGVPGLGSAAAAGRAPARGRAHPSGRDGAGDHGGARRLPGQRLPAAITRDEGPRQAQGAVRQMSTTDQILSDFIDAWNAGERPRVRDYLARAPVGAARDDARPPADDVARGRADAGLLRGDAGEDPRRAHRAARARGGRRGRRPVALGDPGPAGARRPLGARRRDTARRALRARAPGARPSRARRSTSSASSAGTSSPRASRGGCSMPSPSCSARAPARCVTRVRSAPRSDRRRPAGRCSAPRPARATGSPTTSTRSHARRWRPRRRRSTRSTACSWAGRRASGGGAGR